MLSNIPNCAVEIVYFTERTPPEIVEEIRNRLDNPLNCYGSVPLAKLVLSSSEYGYREQEP